MGARRKKSKKQFDTKAEELLKTTVFFTDWCLGRTLGAALRAKGLQVEIHVDHFAQDMSDEELYAETANRSWVMLTKDKDMKRKPHEQRALVAAGARVLTLPNGNMTGDEMKELYVSNLAKIGRFLKDNEAPFLATVSKTGIAPKHLPTQPNAG